MISMAFHQEEFFDVVETFEPEIFYGPEEAYAQGETLVRAGVLSLTRASKTKEHRHFWLAASTS